MMNTLSIDEYSGQGLVTFSYDDGRLNNFELAMPLHMRHDITASFAIIAGRTVERRFWDRHMAPWQVTTAAQNGFEIASHGYRHRTKFTEMSAEDLEFELRESRLLLSGLLPNRKKVSSICIPFSSFNQDVLNKAGEHYRIVRVNGSKLNDPVKDTRVVYSYGLNNETTAEQVCRLLDQAAEERKWLVLMLHGVTDNPGKVRKYDITKDTLDRILEHAAGLGRERLLPARFSDILAIRDAATRQKVQKPARQASAIKVPLGGRAVISEAEGYMITYHRAKNETDKVVISFGGLPSKKTRSGFGSKFILKQGYDHIFVAQEAGSQYQKLPLDVFRDAVAPLVEGKKAFTYGSSLGGYCAVYYGGVIDATIIASGPKNSAHQSMRKKKFSHIEFLHSEIADNPVSNKKPVIIFDPLRDEETNFIRNCISPAYPDAHLVKCPFAGHTVLNTMLESGVLKQFIITLIEEDRVMDFKLREEDSYIWNAEKGRYYLKEGRHDLAERHLKESLKLRFHKEALLSLLQLYTEQNRETDKRDLLAAAEREMENTAFIPAKFQPAQDTQPSAGESSRWQALLRRVRRLAA